MLEPGKSVARRAGSAFSRLETLAGTWRGAGLLFVFALAVYAVQAIA